MSSSPSNSRDPFQTIDPDALSQVGGGASRVTARTTGNSDELTLLTQLTQQIQAMSQNTSQSDPMQMMLMMMMMMGGMGGGGGGAVAAAPAPTDASQVPVINISTTVKRHGC